MGLWGVLQCPYPWDSSPAPSACFSPQLPCPALASPPIHRKGSQEPPAMNFLLTDLHPKSAGRKVGRGEG